ncbi:MAG: hypothetical protein K2I84_04355, partial [Bacteroidales bacterium]|nr:hypothetical protein [Bacteroidales bacterium]
VRRAEPAPAPIRPVEPRKLKKISVAPSGSVQGPNPAAPANGAQPQSGGYAAGQRVAHAKFGLGTLVEIQGAGSDQRLIVQFDSLPQPKTLLTAFAKLQIVG